MFLAPPPGFFGGARPCPHKDRRPRRPIPAISHATARLWNPFDVFRNPPPPPLDLDAPAVRVDHISKSYWKKIPKTKRREKVDALQDVSFSVARGEIFALLGPNASGKTTALRCLATLSLPDSGSIEMYSLDLLKYSEYARRLLGYVEQNAGLDSVLTGREHLELFADLNHLDSARKRRNIDELIEILDLSEHIDTLTSKYSGGIKKRLDIALALIGQPPILILDEPSTGLDVESRTVIWNVLRTLRANGTAIVLTSHYLEEVDYLADSLLIIDHGRPIAAGTPSALKEALGGDRVTIRLSEFTPIAEAERVLARLEAHTGLVSKGLVNVDRGNAVELVVPVDGGENVSARIMAVLEEAGVKKLFSFSQSRASLGDVYLSATGKDFTDADMQAKERRDAKSLRKEQMR